MRRYIGVALATLIIGAFSCSTIEAERLVLLHTNDTHSLIDPENGQGGVLQRKALIDSIRKAEKNVLLIDAGDMVQGTLYFKFFKGEVEYPLMNMTGYDVRILGNHEFDNGLDEMARFYKDVKGDRLAANYDFSETPLKGMFQPYSIKKVGGKKIGFIGVNVDPANLISRENYEGMKFKDVISTVNSTASYLKNDKKVDLVVLVSHLGVARDNEKVNDYDVASASKDVDIIIGGHSHTVLQPRNEGKFPSIVKNAEGKDVLITQTGKYGKYLGYINIDLDNLGKGTAGDYDYRLLPVTDRFPAGTLDKKMEAFIAPYRAVVDSVNNRVIAYSKYTLSSDDRNGGYANWTADFARQYGKNKLDSLRGAGEDVPGIDFALMNVGGIRHDMKEGKVTEGQILATFPFSNHIVVAKIKGSDFIEAMKVAALRGGEAISSELRVLTDEAGVLQKVLLDGEEMDPDKEYVYATIDYLFFGNDDLVTLANSELIWRDENEAAVPILKYVTRQGEYGIPIAPDMNGRFVKVKK